ncbi:Protein of unknown function DUF4615 [Trinorchestia longiramus]|nr:Protein of unknown function DUF4615 [Trinorchestia longiramus]
MADGKMKMEEEIKKLKAGVVLSRSELKEEKKLKSIKKRQMRVQACEASIYFLKLLRVVSLDSSFTTMAPPKRGGKQKNKQNNHFASKKKTQEVRRQPTNDAGINKTGDAADDTATDYQFTYEVMWCLQLLDALRTAPKTTERQAADIRKAMKSLLNDTTPLIKKRQLMRSYCGDYRAKMADDERKMRAVKASIATCPSPPKASEFHRAASHCSSASPATLTASVDCASPATLTASVDCTSPATLTASVDCSSASPATLTASVDRLSLETTEAGPPLETQKQNCNTVSSQNTSTVLSTLFKNKSSTGFMFNFDLLEN